MIIVMGEFRLKAEVMVKIQSNIDEVIRKSNEESGCISYKFSEAIGDPGLIRVSEKWHSFGDLEKHFQTDHMTKCRKIVQENGGDTSRDVSSYEITLAKKQ